MSSFVDAITGNSSSQTSGAQGYTKGMASDYNRQIMELYERSRGALDPYAAAGAGVLGQLGDKVSGGFNVQDFQADPGYQFALEQGTRATQNAAGTRGSPFGGNALAAIDEYSQGLANQTYQNAFNRWETGVGNLQNLAGMGASAANTQAGIGGTFASVLAQILSAATGNVTSAANNQTNANVTALKGSVLNPGINIG